MKNDVLTVHLNIVYKVGGVEVTPEEWQSSLTRRIQKAAAVKLGKILLDRRCAEHDREATLVLDDEQAPNVSLRCCCDAFKERVLGLIAASKVSEGQE